MSNQKDQTLNRVNQEDGGAADDREPDAAPHRDWGHRQAGEAGNAQSDARGNIGGVPGGQHNDWGHSPVDTRSTGLPRQGVMPGEEMGHLQRRKSDG